METIYKKLVGGRLVTILLYGYIDIYIYIYIEEKNGLDRLGRNRERLG